ELFLWSGGFWGRRRRSGRRSDRKGVGNQQYFSGIRKLIRVGPEKRNLPHLRVVQYALEGRHPGQADAVFYFPVTFLRRIVGDALALEHQGRVGVKIAGHRWRGLVGQTVAPGAIVPIK